MTAFPPRDSQSPAFRGQPPQPNRPPNQQKKPQPAKSSKETQDLRPLLAFGIGGLFLIAIPASLYAYRYYSVRSQLKEQSQTIGNEFSASINQKMAEASEQMERDFAKARAASGEAGSSTSLQADIDSKVPRGDYDPRMEVKWKDNPEMQARSERQREQKFAILEAPTIKRWLGKDTRPAFTSMSSSSGDNTRYKLTFRNVSDEIAEAVVKITGKRIVSATLQPRDGSLITIPASEIRLP